MKLKKFDAKYEKISEYFQEQINDTMETGEIEAMDEAISNAVIVVSNLIELLMDKGIIESDEDTIDKLLKGGW